jgi:hypothetical protein
MSVCQANHRIDPFGSSGSWRTSPTTLPARDHLIRFPCDAALMTWALTLVLTWALTLKLALNGPVAFDAPTALTHLAQISQTSIQGARS